MHATFEDITSRIAEAPAWWDENGTPRYGAFTPRASPNIYASEAVLFEIECHNCKRNYKVSLTSRHGELVAQIGDGVLKYGDPPRWREVEGCCSNGSMALRVLEYWCKDSKHNWARDFELEIELPKKRRRS